MHVMLDRGGDWAVVLAFIACCAVPTAQAGPFDKLKKKVEDKVGKKTDEKTDEAVEKGAGKTAEPGEGAQESKGNSGGSVSSVSTNGKGDTEPLSSNAKPEGRAMNRRVAFAKSEG